MNAMPESDGHSADDIETGRLLFTRAWMFSRGSPGLDHLPPDDRPEIAFAGRSNVGKSSLLNALVGQHGLARASNTPGRTQELNFFTDPEADLYLVDMPGYGFAEAPRDVVKRWRNLIDRYLRGRAVLRRALLLIDARHGLKDIDREVMTMLDAAAVSYHLVLTKSDKVKPTALAALIERTAAEARSHSAAHPEILATSAETGAGIAALRAAVVEATL